MDTFCDFVADGLYQFNLKGRLLAALIWLVPGLIVLAVIFISPFTFPFITIVLLLFLLGGFLAFPEGMAKESPKVFWVTLVFNVVALIAGWFLSGIVGAPWVRSIYGSEAELCLPILLLGSAAGAITGRGTRCQSGLVAGIVSGPLAGHLSALVNDWVASWFAVDKFLYVPGPVDIMVIMGASMAVLPLVIYPGVWLGVRIGEGHSTASTG